MTRNMKFHPVFAQNQMPANLEEVESLNLKLEPSTHLFEGIGEKFRNIKFLGYFQDTFEFVERRDFANMEQLEELSMYYVQIVFLPEDLFADLPNLKSIYLASNQIESVPENLLMNQRKLESVYFPYNKITHLHKDLFKNNLLLKHIDFRNNPFQKISVDFVRLVKLGSINLWNAECIRDTWNNETAIETFQAKVNSLCQ